MGEKKNGERTGPQRFLEGRTIIGVDHADQPDKLVLVLDDGNRVGVGAVRHVEIVARTLKDELGDVKAVGNGTRRLNELLAAKEVARTTLTVITAATIAQAFGKQADIWTDCAYGDDLVLMCVKS